MLGSGHRLRWAGAAVAILVGLFLPHGLVHALDRVDARPDRPTAPVLDLTAPVGTLPSAYRAHGWPDAERVGSMVPASGLVLFPLVVLWCLRRPDRRVGAPLTRSSLPPRRGPPALAVV